MPLKAFTVTFTTVETFNGVPWGNVVTTRAVTVVTATETSAVEYASRLSAHFGYGTMSSIQETDV